MELLKISRRPAVFAGPDMTVREVVKLMAREGVGAVIVTGPNNQLLGIFTERDHLLRVTNCDLNPETTRISQVMTQRVQTASTHTTVDEGLETMIRNRYRHLPIVDGANRVLGIASIRYLLMRQIQERKSDINVLAAYVAAGGPG